MSELVGIIGVNVIFALTVAVVVSILSKFAYFKPTDEAENNL